jgi:predicted PhzF superfamily epimerase YddE/YHI9
VPGVRASDSYQQVAFWSEIVGNVAFALAAVLATDDHLDKPPAAARQQAQSGRGADLHVTRVAVSGVDSDIRVAGEASYLLSVSFCATSA